MDYLFSGTFLFSLTKTRRLAIPAIFRRQVRDEAGEPMVFYLLPGHEGQILVYPEATFRELAPMLTQEAGALLRDESCMERVRTSRQILAGSCPARVSADGRIIIPKDLADHAGLKDSALVIGLVTRMEIWDPERFEKQKND